MWNKRLCSSVWSLDEDETKSKGFSEITRKSCQLHNDERPVFFSLCNCRCFGGHLHECSADVDHMESVWSSTWYWNKKHVFCSVQTEIPPRKQTSFGVRPILCGFVRSSQVQLWDWDQSVFWTWILWKNKGPFQSKEKDKWHEALANPHSKSKLRQMWKCWHFNPQL